MPLSVRIGAVRDLAAARHHVTLRHAHTQEYHSVLLFAFADTYYCMEATCPHLGAPLENAHVELEDAVVVCPWHQYDFSLATGESSTGLRSCVYDVSVVDGDVFIAPPTEDAAGGSSLWEVISVRPVSEKFADMRPAVAAAGASAPAGAAPTEFDPSTIPPPSPLPTTITAWAVLILNTPDPLHKVAYTRHAGDAFRTGACRAIGGTDTPPSTPPRLASEICVAPGAEGKRGRGGTVQSRIALLHALANIEQWAIDLAWDIIARAPALAARIPGGVRMPVAFFADFVKVACDEAKHFTLLQRRLLELGSYFGALPVHHGLWQSAQETAHDLYARLSIIHLVHEARGLDVNPVTIKKFDAAGDAPSVDTLTIIHLDEITHVSAGHRWLTFLCQQHAPPLDPVATFRTCVHRNFVGRLKGPFNAADRATAGLSPAWYEGLAGEKASTRGVARAEVPGG